MNVANKVAIVTGASSGIGKATAVLLSQTGAKVVLAARSKDKLKQLGKELPNSLVLPTDMTDSAQIKKMINATIAKFGRIDILVNNAGCGYDGFVEKIDLTKYQYLIDLNLLGPLIAAQEVIPYMRRQGGGAIINISSGTSRLAIPNLGAYSSLKRALNGLSLTAREELANDKISVSVVYPYITATDFGKNILGGPRRGFPRDNSLPAMDSSEHVAEKILEAIQTGKAEVFAHEWMEN